MKNQVRPVCSPKDKIWSQTDKLQRCRRLPLEQAKLRQILENNSEGVLIRKWFDRWYVAESLCYRLRCKINHVLISQQHEFRRGRQFFPYEYPQYPPGWIYPLPGPYMFNDQGNPSPSPSTTSTDSLPESLQFSEDSSMPASTPSSSRRASSSAENKKAQDRWSKEEEKLLVQLWAEITRRSQHGVVFCSQILFLSATVALRANFLSLADFKSNLSRPNVKLPSSATWPLMFARCHLK